VLSSPTGFIVLSRLQLRLLGRTFMKSVSPTSKGVGDEAGSSNIYSWNLAHLGEVGLGLLSGTHLLGAQFSSLCTYTNSCITLSSSRKLTIKELQAHHTTISPLSTFTPFISLHSTLSPIHSSSITSTSATVIIVFTYNSSLSHLIFPSLATTTEGPEDYYKDTHNNAGATVYEPF